MRSIGGVISQGRGSMDPSVYIDPRSDRMLRDMAGFSANSSIQSANRDILPVSSRMAWQTVNYHISYVHTEVPWTNNSHMYISPGAILFGDRHSENQTNIYSADATLATVNDILRDGYTRFSELELSNSEAQSFAANLKNPDMMAKAEAYRYMLANGYPVGKFEDAKDFARNMTKYQYRCMTKVGILNKFNFLGVVQSRGDSSDQHDREYKQSQVCNISFVSRGRIKAANIWGGPKEVTHGSKLYLVLNRNERGMFQIQPRVTRSERLSPKEGDEHVWYVGRVTYRADSMPSTQFITSAISHKDPVTAYKAVESLPRITIDVRI